ncbi:hypothetical protein HK100_012664 [Physocladia obscura]|uniref:Uncharacterized protein n=1 Tax=Physocladia obscura TaxID=109957 RepID=A0AAD5XHG3_9FUNG|nr:hypothetical protein HK100_012664 [Physocladia obscura]
MIKQVGKGNLILANMTKETIANAPQNIKEGAICTEESAQKYAGGIEKVLLLDPSAKQELSPEDSAAGFEYLLFGGILGDDPPRDRTKELRVQGFSGRHLGNYQMTTDTAVLVSKRVIEGGKKLSELEFVDKPDINLSSHESVEMPFRYLVENGAPLLPAGFLELLRKTNNDSLF